jgi:hypothetical protein
VRHHKTLGVDRAEGRQRVVECPCRLAPAVLDQIEEPKRAHFAIQHFGVDTVGVHVLQSLMRIAVPGTTGRRMRVAPHHRGVGLARVAPEHTGLELRDRRVVGVVVLARKVALHRVVLKVDVRIG